jgi:hypothetical protein
MRFNDLSVGSDGRNRTLLGPFGSKTARNQPSNGAAREDAVGKKDKRSKKAKKLAREVKKEAKKEKKKSNTEIDRSDVKPPSPFSS